MGALKWGAAEKDERGIQGKRGSVTQRKYFFKNSRKMLGCSYVNHFFAKVYAEFQSLWAVSIAFFFYRTPATSCGPLLAQRRVAPQRDFQQVLRQVFQVLRPDYF
jgi:hypothetical protein